MLVLMALRRDGPLARYDMRRAGVRGVRSAAAAGLFRCRAAAGVLLGCVPAAGVPAAGRDRVGDDRRRARAAGTGPATSARL